MKNADFQMGERRMGWLGVFLAATVMSAGASQALPLLSEVYYDASGSDDGKVFVEISGAPGFSLDGLWLEGVNGSNGAIAPTILLSGVIGQDGLFVIADQTSSGTTAVLGADLLANFDFQNGPDSVVLRSDVGVLDAVGYGVFSPSEIFAGEGAAAPDAPAGSSLSRAFANVDLDDNASDFFVSSPTPGVATFAPVPEPGSALMLGLGLASLGSVRDRRERGPVTTA